MGYYTQFEMDVKIKPEKVNALREALVIIKEASQNKTDHWYLWFNDMTIGEPNKDGDIYVNFDEYSRKWYEPDKLYELLKDYAVDGSEIRGQGEEFGDVWICSFKGGEYRIYEPIWEERR